MAKNLALATITATGASASRSFGDRFVDVVRAKDFGITPATSDIGPLFQNLPKNKEVWFDPGVYTVATYPTQAAFSNVFYRGIDTVWLCTGSLGADLTVSGYTTLDPANKSGTITLSNGNLTATIASGGSGSPQVQSATSVSSGKYHIELTTGSNYETTHAQNCGWGLCTGSHSFSNFLGQDTASVGWFDDGSVLLNNTSILTANTGTQFTASQVLVIEWDVGNKLLWVKNFTAGGNWNNNAGANPATGAGGLSISGMTGSAFFAAIELSGVGHFSTINFGATSFSVTPSAGFTSWPISNQIAFNWIYESSVTLPNYNIGQSGADMSQSGLSPIEGIGIISGLDGNAGVGIAFGQVASDASYPENYFLRPRNFSVGGFYINVGFLNPLKNCFVTGLENVVMKGGNIGLYLNNLGSSNSGENLTFIGCDFDGLTSDGAQVYATQKCTFDGCSFDYNHRAAYLSNAYTVFKGCYFETNSTFTPAELIAVDGGSTVIFDQDTSILMLPSSGSDYVAFDGGSTANPTVHFRDTAIFDTLFEQTGTRQFAITATPSNAFGRFIGFNGFNFPIAVNPDSCLQPDWNFASGGLTFYPGGSGGVSNQSSVVHSPQTNAAALTGVAALGMAQIDVTPGEYIFITFWDQIIGTITALGGGLNFFNRNGTQIGSTVNYSVTTPVPNFHNGPLDPAWTNAVRSWTLQNFVFRVPIGASYMTGTLTTTGGAGNYYVSEFAVYR